MSEYFIPGNELDYAFGAKDRSNSKRKAMSAEERKRRQKLAQKKHKGKTVTELGLSSTNRVYVESTVAKSNRFYFATHK